MTPGRVGPAPSAVPLPGSRPIPGSRRGSKWSGLPGIVLAVCLVAGVSRPGIAQEPERWRVGDVPEALAAVETRAVEVASDGSVWVAVRDRGLARIRDGRLGWVTEEAGLVSNGIADLHEDVDGRLWAVGFGGIGWLDGTVWTASRSVGGRTPRVVFTVHQAPDGALWFGTTEGAARLDTNGGWTAAGLDEGLPHEVVHAIVEDERGVVWAACRTGLGRLEDGRAETRFEDLNIRSALADGRGTIWFGTSDGVLRWDGSEWTRHLRGRTLLVRLAASDGSVWAGATDGGAYRWDGSVWRAVTLPEHVAGAEVFDFAEDAAGTIWVATGAGLVRLDAIWSGGPVG